LQVLSIEAQLVELKEFAAKKISNFYLSSRVKSAKEYIKNINLNHICKKRVL